MVEQTNFCIDNLSEDKLHLLINNTESLNGICCSPVSLCPNNKNLLGISRLPQRNIYVIFNIPYAMTREFLEYFLGSDEYEALGIDYGNFTMILMAYKSKLLFLFPIFPDLSQTFHKDNSQKFNITITPSDELFEKEKINGNTISIVDSIVNCVFQIRPKK